MRKGAIILFCNNEHQIEKHQLIEYFRKIPELKICLANNESKDNTLNLLEEIKEFAGQNISVLDIKKKFPVQQAQKAGLRYLTNSFNLRDVKFFNVYSEKLSPAEVTQKIKKVCESVLLVDSNV